MKALNAHVWDREANEHYVEPEWCSRRLFEEESFFPSIWDPCCGFGRIPDEAAKLEISAIGTDIVDRGYQNLERVTNFLEAESTYSPNIVCNPPFNIAAEFALHALSLATERVAMIFPTARLNAAHWLHVTPLQRIWFMTPRPSMPPGHVIAAGGKPGGGKMDYCWLVWDKDHSGPPEARWLVRDRVSNRVPEIQTESADHERAGT